MILFAFVLFAVLLAGWLFAPKSTVKADVKPMAMAETPLPRLQLTESPA